MILYKCLFNKKPIRDQAKTNAIQLRALYPEHFMGDFIVDYIVSSGRWGSITRVHCNAFLNVPSPSAFKEKDYNLLSFI